MYLIYKKYPNKFSKILTVEQELALGIVEIEPIWNTITVVKKESLDGNLKTTAETT